MTDYTGDFLYCMLRACFKKFAMWYGSLFSKYGVSMKRHIWEGICIPLEARHDLKKNVTARGWGQCAVQSTGIHDHDPWHTIRLCQNSCPTRIPGLRR